MYSNNLKKHSPSSTRGFSILEILIVIALIAFLILLALPNYRNYILQANRQDGMQAITQATQALERHYAIAKTYEGIDTAALTPSPEGHYAIALTDLSNSTYTVRATAQGEQANDAVEFFQTNQTGNQTRKNKSGTAILNGWK